MATVAQEQVAAGGESVGEMELAAAPARRADDRTQLGPDDRGPPTLIGEARRHQSDNSHRPRPADDRRRRVVDGIRRDSRFGDGRAQQVAPRDVGSLEHGGEIRRFGGVVGEEQPGRVERLPHPTGRVEPRRHGEGERLEVDVRRGEPGDGEQRGETGPRLGAECLQPEADDRPVLAEHGGEVCHGPDRRQVREPEGGVVDEQSRHRERDAAAREALLRVVRVGAMRVDDGQGRRQLGRHAVMVGDDHVDPGGVRRRHLGDAR